ncbi:MAG TPA: hypothetical protein ENI97_06715 [Gammaproteobacteria bacterium]|nr:hypothetical protein [Gammaproteobacteria bacterium]
MPAAALHHAFRILSVISLGLLLAACSTKDLEFWRQVPIQMTRVTQTESYTQTFRLNNAFIDRKEQPARDQALDENMDKIFTTMIGAKNWQYLKDLYGISTIRDELIDGKIHMDGLITFNAYIDPTDLKHLVIEGSGRYFAIRDKTDAILMSGNFQIPPQRYRIKTLDRGCIPLDIKLYTTRIPGKTTYFKKTLIHYDLNIDTSNAEYKAYALIYDNPHAAYLDLDNNGIFDPETEHIANLNMTNKYHHVKIFDLRGLNLIKMNYHIDEKARLSSKLEGKKDQQRQCVIYPDQDPASEPAAPADGKNLP